MWCWRALCNNSRRLGLWHGYYGRTRFRKIWVWDKFRTATLFSTAPLITLLHIPQQRSYRDMGNTVAWTFRQGSESPTVQFTFQTQSANAVPSPMINLVNDMKAKLFVGLGATQLVLGILEIVVNIGASVMRADIIWQIGPGYWCGLPVGSQIYMSLNLTCLNTLRPRQNRRHFADDIFKRIFVNENIWIPIKISLNFVPKGSINNIPSLVQIIAWRRPGDKPLSEPMMV